MRAINFLSQIAASLLFGLLLIFFSYGVAAQTTLTATNINWSPENANFVPADRNTLATIDTGENQEMIRVALSSAPSGPVTLTVISSSPEDITANVDTLTFTPTNFDQTVTVTTRENDDFWQPIKDISFTFRVITGPSDVPVGREAVARGQLRTRPLQLISLPNRRVISSIQENEVGLLNVNLFQVVTSGTVTLTVSTAEESGVSFSPSLLEFVPITVNGTIQTSYSDKRVQIRSADDLVGTPPRTPFRVTVALHGERPEGYILNDRIWPAAVDRPPNIHSGFITITEDDSPSFVVSPSSDFIVTANEISNLTVSLPKGPYTGNVVVTVASNSVVDARIVGQDLLTFTGGASGNWATPQFVAVRGGPRVSRRPFNITFSIVDVDTNNLFDNLATQVVSGVAISSYRPVLTTTPESQLAVINEGKTTTFTAQLRPPIAGNAVMTISSLNPEIATVHTRVTVTLASGSARAFRTTSLTVSASSVRDGRTSHLVTVTTTAGAKHVGTIAATDTYTVTVTGVSDLETSSVVRPYMVMVDAISGPNNIFTAPPAVTLSGTVTDAALILDPAPIPRDILEGTKTTITVALAAPPEAGTANNVTVQVSSASSLLSEDKSELVFTSVNWNIPQHIIVTAADDNSPIILTRTGMLRLEVPLGSGAGSYEGIIKSYTFTVRENSQPPYPDPGLLITVPAALNPNTLDLVESTTITVSIALNSIPLSADNGAVLNTAAVLVRPSFISGYVTVTSPTTLTFESRNWDRHQTFVISAPDDSFINAQRDFSIVFTARSLGAPAYNNTALDVTLSGTVIDDENADMTFIPATLILNEAEASPDPNRLLDSSTTLAVTLNADPQGTVVVTLESNSDAVTLCCPFIDTLTFTSSNWDLAHNPFFIQPINNNLTGDQNFEIKASVVSSSNPSSGITVGISSTLSGTVLDDEAPLILTPSPNLPRLTETGSDTMTTVRVQLSSAPSSAVTIAATIANTVAATVRPTMLIFTPSNWNRDQEVVITTVDNEIVHGVLNYIASFSIVAAPPSFATLGTEIRLTGQITDDDMPSMTVIPPSPIDIEEGAESTFTVVLDKAPTANVVLSLTYTPPADDLELGSNLLTFTSGNWNIAQTVRITGLADIGLDGDIDYEVTVSITQPYPPPYQDLPAQTFSGKIIDNTSLAIVLDPQSRLDLDEGTDATVSVALSVPVSNDLIVTVTSSDPSIASVSPVELTFTPANWNQNQMLMVTGQDNMLVNGNQDFTVEFTTTSETLGTLTGTVFDDEMAGITLNPTTLNVNENESGTFTAVLTGQPTDNVTLTVSSSDPSEATVSPSSLIFTSANWNMTQTVNVMGVADRQVDNDQNYTIAVASTSSSDSFYRNVSAEISGVIADTTMPGLIIQPSSSVSVEEGSSTMVTVGLDAQPSDDVIVTVTSTSPNTLATVTPTALTFRAAAWTESQTINIEASNDNFVNPTDRNYQVTLSVSGGPAGYLTVVTTLTATVQDNDVAGLRFNPDTINLNENSDSVTVSLTLSAQPQSGTEVYVTLSNEVSGSLGATLSLGDSTLTFMSADWNTPQEFSIIPLDDNFADGPSSISIVASVLGTSTATEFIGTSQTLTGTVADDETIGFSLEPSDRLPEVAMGETDLSVTVMLSDFPVTDVVLSATVSDTLVATVTPVKLTFTGGGTATLTQTLTIREASDASLDMCFTLTVAVDDDMSDDAFDSLAPKELRSVGCTDLASQSKSAAAVADTLGSAQVVSDLITGHIQSPLTSRPQVQLGGTNLGLGQEAPSAPAPVLAANQEDPWDDEVSNDWNNDLEQLLSGTNFVLPLSDRDSKDSSLEVWGSAGLVDMQGDPQVDGEIFDYDGQATGIQIGVSRRYVNGTTFGVSIGSTRVRLDVAGDGVRKVRRDLISIHPYVGWSPIEGLDTWLIAGFGDGDYELEEDNGDITKTKAAMQMIGGGVSRSWVVNNYDLTTRLEGISSRSKVDAKADLTEDSSSAWTARAEFEIGRTYETEAGNRVQPYSTFGYRREGGDLGSSGAGELGFGLRTVFDKSWTADFKARFQISDADHERNSFQGFLKYDRNTDRRGWLLSLEHEHVRNEEPGSAWDHAVTGRLGYGWGKALFGRRGILGLRLQSAFGTNDSVPTLGMGFDSPSLTLDLVGDRDEIRADFNYTITRF